MATAGGAGPPQSGLYEDENSNLESEPLLMVSEMSEDQDAGRRNVPQETRARAFELVGMIRNRAFSHEEQAAFESEIEYLIPYPAWSDLIFWHEPDLSDEEVVQEALQYRPTAL